MSREPLISAEARQDDATVNQGRLSSLYARWRKPLVQLLRGRLANADEAEDAAQDVFVRLAASGKLPEPGKEKAYLSRSAEHLVIDGWRKNGKAKAVETISEEDCGDELINLPGDGVHDPVEQAQRLEHLARLESALAELPERQRQAFTLNVLDGYTQEEVADQMGISLRMVSKHISLAFAYCELRLQYGSFEQMRRLRIDDCGDDEPRPTLESSEKKRRNRL